MSENNVLIHRVLNASPEKIFRAFTEAAAIPADMCYLGWQESLKKLAKLVEPVIPDT